MSLIKKNGGSHPAISEFFDMDSFFRPFFSDFGVSLTDANMGSRFPSVNISETEKDYRIEVAAPGFDKKDFKVEMDKGLLVISGEKKEEPDAEKETWHRREFISRNFSRSFQLPDNSVIDKADARYENGILRLIVPKKDITISPPKKEIRVS